MADLADHHFPSKLPQIGDLIRLTFWKTHMCESPRLFAD
jgi:hypothetical protein